MGVSLDPAVLWPPNHQMVPITAAVTAADNCGSATCSLTSVSSSEPDNDIGNGDGNTDNDVQNAGTGTLDLSFDLRAERAGTGQGRLYTVVYACTDSDGNVAEHGGTVFVPHDQAGVDDPVNVEITLDGEDTILSWPAVESAEYYSVIRGDTANLTETTEFLNLGAVACLEPHTINTNRLDAETPALGQAYFYLVAYHHGMDSTYGSPSASKPRIPSGSCP